MTCLLCERAITTVDHCSLLDATKGPDPLQTILDAYLGEAHTRCFMEHCHEMSAHPKTFPCPDCKALTPEQLDRKQV